MRGDGEWEMGNGEMKLNRYPKYKPTNIPWLPEVPEEWEVVRLGVLGSLSNGLSKGGESFGTGFPFVAYGDVYRNSALPMMVKGLVQSTLAEQKACSVLRGDVFFTRTSESIEEIGFSSVCLSDLDQATFAGFLIRLRPRGNEVMPEFSRFYFRNFRLRVYFQLRISGLITRASLSQSVLRDLPVLLPPLPTQRVIVAFLDGKCGKINRWVAAKEKEVALLKELKQSMIAEAVTGATHVARTDTARKMKPSGIPWLPEVPEGWEVKRLKWILTEIKKLSLTGEEMPLSLTASNGLIPFAEKSNRTMESASYIGAKVVENGQIVFNRFKARLFAIASCRGVVSPDYAVYATKIEVDKKYLLRLFSTPQFRQAMNGQSSGIGDGFSRVYSNELFKLLVPLPPLPTQRKIVAYIEARAAKIDAAVSGLEREVAAMKEYKQRLIADVVTGQRKVA